MDSQRTKRRDVNHKKYKEFNTPRKVKYKDPLGLEKEGWFYRGLLRSEAWKKRYDKSQEYEKRLEEKRREERGEKSWMKRFMENLK